MPLYLAQLGSLLEPPFEIITTPPLDELELLEVVEVVEVVEEELEEPEPPLGLGMHKVPLKMY